MERRNFLKSIGLAGAVVMAIPVSPFASNFLRGEKEKNNVYDIFFAEQENEIYLLFRNGDMIFKEVLSKSKNVALDKQELKINMLNSLLQYYGK
jgi:hypothetical protein